MRDFETSRLRLACYIKMTPSITFMNNLGERIFITTGETHLLRVSHSFIHVVGGCGFHDREVVVLRIFLASSSVKTSRFSAAAFLMIACYRAFLAEKRQLRIPQGSRRVVDVTLGTGYMCMYVFNCLLRSAVCWYVGWR